MLTSRGLPSTVLHCTPHFPTVNAQFAEIAPSSPLKRQVDAVERSGGRSGTPMEGEPGGQRRRSTEKRGTGVTLSATKDVL